MNKVVLIGRLTKAPELKFTPGTGHAVTTVTLAVNKYNASTKKMEADFIQVVIWGKQAEATANHMGKGSLMAISGRVTTRSYDANDGTKRYVTEIVAKEVQFLENKKDKGINPYDMYSGDITPVDDSDVPF